VIFSSAEWQGGADWKTAMRERAISAREALSRHRWAIGLLESPDETRAPSDLTFSSAFGSRAQLDLPSAGKHSAVLQSNLLGESEASAAHRAVVSGRGYRGLHGYRGCLGRTPPPARGKRGEGKGRNPGKQPGAPGSHLAWSQDPERTVPHFPRGACACGADLAGAADLGVAASHQQIEIPEMTAKIIQHDLHEVACACGRVHRAAAPAGAGAPGTVTYGIGLQAWCAYLMAAHAIPVHRVAELVEALTGARPSPGFVHGLLARAAAAVRDANQLIRALIILARVICAERPPSGPARGRRVPRPNHLQMAKPIRPKY
jgi:hypothetical protein